MPCALRHTDSRFVAFGKAYPNIPLLEASNGTFVESVCAYLLHLVIYGHLKPGTAKTYAEAIQCFWRFLEIKRLDYKNVSDADLIRWFNLQSPSANKETQAKRCDVVHAFYVWAELNGYVDHVVRIPGWNDDEKFRPKLSSIPARKTRGRRGLSRRGIVSGVRPSPRSNVPQKTPTDYELTRVYEAVIKTSEITRALERNILLLDWYRQVGVRRMEWVALRTKQIPDWATIDGLREKRHAFELLLRETKFDKSRYVPVLPELLAKTREYVEGPRAELVDRFRRRKDIAYCEPTHVFLSEKTGLAMNAKSISNLVGRWFRVAGVDSHGHRVRAAYLMSLVEAEIRAEITRMHLHPETKRSIDYELILRKVADRAGHKDISSLRPYLTYAKKRLARGIGESDLLTVREQIDAARRELAVLERRIELAKKELLGSAPAESSVKEAGWVRRLAQQGDGRHPPMRRGLRT